MDGMDQPVTRSEMEALLKSFAEHIDHRFEGVDKRITEVQEELEQRIEKSETSLLTAFHQWSRTHELRSRAVTTAVVGFDERLALVEDRLAEVERKILGNGHPPAAA
jgi:tetrahydromethanopterin S-methyltransferase subunit G